MANYSTTLTATYISAIPDVEQASKGFNRKIVIPYTFVAQASATTATDTVTVTLGNTPANWVVNNARAVVTTAFTQTGTQTITVNVGTTSSTSAFITAQSVLTVASLGAAANLPTAVATGTSALSMVAVFTNAAAGSLSATTAGSLTILLNVQDVSDSTFQPNQ